VKYSSQKVPFLIKEYSKRNLTYILHRNVGNSPVKFNPQSVSTLTENKNTKVYKKTTFTRKTKRTKKYTKIM
jgi:hypothetical protein